LLLSATGLLILVILSIISWVIPHVIQDIIPGASPEKAVLAFWTLIAIHLIIMTVLIGIIMVSRRGGRLRKTWFIIPGIILILISMLLLDAAGSCLEQQPDMISVPIVLFSCAICDMMAGIITIMLPTRIPEKPDRL